MKRLSLLSLFYSICTCAVLCADTLPNLTDTQGNPVDASFYNRDYTLVLVVNRSNIDWLSEKIAEMQKEFAGKKTGASAGKRPMDDFQILLLWDGREDFRRQYRQETAKYDAPVRRSGRVIHRRKLLRRMIGTGIVAPKKLAEGDQDMKAQVTTSMIAEAGEYLSPDRYRTVALFNSSRDHYTTRGGGQMGIGFYSNGPGNQTLHRIFHNNSEDIQAAIFDPHGRKVPGAEWRGHVDPLDVAERYFDVKGLSMGKKTPLPTVLASQRKIAGVDIGVFARIQELARENIEIPEGKTRTEMEDSLEIFKRYTQKLGACRSANGAHSSEPFREFIIETFQEIERKIRELLAMNPISAYRNGPEVLTYVEKSARLARIYLQKQAKRFHGDHNKLRNAEKLFYDSSWDIYRQVGDLVYRASSVFPRKDLVKEWGSIDLNQYKHDPQYGKGWAPIFEAIEMTDSHDTQECAAHLETLPEPIPHGQTVSADVEKSH